MRTKIYRACVVAAFAAVCALSAAPARADIAVEFVGRYSTGQFDKGAAEIPAYDARTKRLFVVNGADAAIDILDIANPAAPRKHGAIDLKPYGAAANSVAVRDGVVAAAVEAKVKTDPGVVAFFDAAGRFLKQVTVGALPDMLAFSPDGRWLVVANEGEPNDDYTVDPEGSVSVIDMRGGVAAVDQSRVRTADFRRFAAADLPAGFKPTKPGATVAQDFEPEYVAFSPDSRTAMVTLQENNGLAVVDLATARVVKLVGLGVVDHMKAPFDASDRDNAIAIKPWPVFGMFQPDAIATLSVGGRTYYVTANEGDARSYKGYDEEKRIAELKLDPAAFPNAAELQRPENLGRMRATNAAGLNAAGLHEVLYTFGTRSFTVWDAEGVRVWDSGDMLERIVAERFPANFNASHTANDRDARSGSKGPEPEGVAIAVLFGKPYAFVGLERISGIAVFDMSNPRAPVFVDYVNSRNFAGDPKAGTAGDLGPEGLIVISAADSPTGEALLAVAYEVSGTTAIYRIRKR